MATKLPRHSAAWCRQQLDLLRARDTCRWMASERDSLIRRIKDLGDRRPNNFDAALQIAGHRERLGHLTSDLSTARCRAERAAEACGEPADVDKYFGAEKRREYGPAVQLNSAPTRVAAKPTRSLPSGMLTRMLGHPGCR